MSSQTTRAVEPRPRHIKLHPRDNVAIVVNDFGLPKGTTFHDGLILTEHVPQGHKVALVAIPTGAAVVRYGVVIGRAAVDLAAGAWVNEQRLLMPEAPTLENLPMATGAGVTGAALDGHTFQGFRNPDGSVGTRNILAVTTTVQCVSGVVEHAISRIKAELLPRYPNVDDVIGLEHIYGCGVAIDAPDAVIPIRTLRNISRNPNFGGATMVVSLGCEKLQPDRLLPPGSPGSYDLVTLQDESNVGFEAMIASIMKMAEQHLKVLDRRRREMCPASAPRHRYAMRRLGCIFWCHG